jgi:signal transduction histidine kinase
MAWCGPVTWEDGSMTSEHGWRFDAAAAPHRLFPSVRARSAVASVLVVGLAFALASGVLYYVLQRSLLGGLDSAASVTASEVAARLVVVGEGNLNEELKQGTAREGQLIQVVNPKYGVVATSGSYDQGAVTGLRPKDGQVLREKAGLFKITSDQRPFLALTRGVKYADGVDTVIVISYTEGLRQSVRTVMRLLLIVFPILLLLVGCTLWVLVGRALSPVEKIRQRVAGIGAAELADRVPIPQTRDEIAELAITMNQMLDRLQAAQQAQRQFVSDASHELRSPLATLSATLEVADADVTGSAWHDLRSVMSSEADRMSILVENLLLLARADDQGLRIIPVEVDLDDLMEEEARRLRTSSDLFVQTSIIPVRVPGDRLKLSQVIRNLVDNASRYARFTVSLSLEVVGSSAVIMIDDDGPGIPESQRARVFERFVRLDESRDRASGGAGLGLPIVYEVVRGHRGEVAVGTSPEGGCRLLVRLPILATAQLTVERSPRASVELPADSIEPSQPPVVESR